MEKKMKFKTIVATAILFSITHATTYASTQSSCTNDVLQMYSQIQEYHSITSYDGFRFNDVVNPVNQGSNICSADGFYFNEYVCTIQWHVGDWGDTFHCS